MLHLSRGWCSVTTMQSHVDAHMAGTLAGAIPAAWLQQHGRQRCAVCGLSVSSRHPWPPPTLARRWAGRPLAQPACANQTNQAEGPKRGAEARTGTGDGARGLGRQSLCSTAVKRPVCRHPGYTSSPSGAAPWAAHSCCPTYAWVAPSARTWARDCCESSAQLPARHLAWTHRPPSSAPAGRHACRRWEQLPSATHGRGQLARARAGMCHCRPFPCRSRSGRRAEAQRRSETHRHWRNLSPHHRKVSAPTSSCWSALLSLASPGRGLRAPWSRGGRPQRPWLDAKARQHQWQGAGEARLLQRFQHNQQRSSPPGNSQQFPQSLALGVVVLWKCQQPSVWKIECPVCQRGAARRPAWAAAVLSSNSAVGSGSSPASWPGRLLPWRWLSGRGPCGGLLRTVVASPACAGHRTPTQLQEVWARCCGPNACCSHPAPFPSTALVWRTGRRQGRSQLHFAGCAYRRWRVLWGTHSSKGQAGRPASGPHRWARTRKLGYGCWSQQPPTVKWCTAFGARPVVPRTSPRSKTSTAKCEGALQRSRACTSMACSGSKQHVDWPWVAWACVWPRGTVLRPTWLQSAEAPNYVGSWTLPTMQSLTAMLPLRFCPTTTILEQGRASPWTKPSPTPKKAWV